MIVPKDNISASGRLKIDIVAAWNGFAARANPYAAIESYPIPLLAHRAISRQRAIRSLSERRGH
jgi:hypothetical protein